MSEFNPPKSERDFALEQAEKDKPPKVTRADQDRMLTAAIRLMHGMPPEATQTPEAESFVERGLHQPDPLGELPEDSEAALEAGNDLALNNELAHDDLPLIDDSASADAQSDSANWPGLFGEAAPPTEPTFEAPGFDSPEVNRESGLGNDGLTFDASPSQAFSDSMRDQFFPEAAGRPLEGSLWSEISSRSPQTPPADATQFPLNPILSPGASEGRGWPAHDFLHRWNENPQGSIQQLPYFPDQDRGPSVVPLSDLLLGSEQASDPQLSAPASGAVNAPQPSAARDEGPAMTRPIVLLSLLDVDSIVEKQLEESAKRFESATREVVTYEINGLEFERAAQMRAIWGK